MDRMCAAAYFHGLEMWLKEVREYLNEVKTSNGTAAFLDVCGQAHARNLGCGTNYHFTVQEPDLLTPLLTQYSTRFVGNIFSPTDLLDSLSQIIGDGHQLSLVTFFPVAGLQPYTPHRKDKVMTNVVYQKLFCQLELLVEMLRPGGYIFLERPFPLCPFDTTDFFHSKKPTKYTSHKWIKVAAKKLNCNLRVMRTIRGNVWLLKKL
ncbi:hypothetical protein A2392_01215 [Candidatus Kaiserbacteria bacterium RIFOXYB1_FULL_46_14]|uniref:Methyltransferase type 11 domain-containing protein n=1 Tax=Candidatus Kaiserbacteria bacterium RIFOXYB1_FULL_46_14 TaxID=1798531 RepID=A0A1F6FJM7_9BACT|nr:MAG: hypothetical protein A2392_01215 [Candidatus Kaiserbacteria bacterium RIFOXYB1_FULL_46_14]